MRIARGLAVTLALVLAGATAGQAQMVPPGFTDERFTDGLDVPTAFAFTPDGRIFVCEQAGAVRVIDNAQVLPLPAIQLAVETFREQGLLGIALDPGFPNAPYVYLLYTHYTGSHTDNMHWVSRFTLDGDVLDPASEVVLFNQIPTGIGFHVGGCLRFGLDGNLLISTGDTNWAPPYPQDLSRLEGKLLRLRPDGSVPPDNPFVGIAGARPEIFQYGLRNPFRFSIQPSTGLAFIGDVGASAWEEVDVGPPGANFGWPIHEGPESVPDSTTVDPLYAYSQGSGSAAITGNVFYTGTMFPTEFDQNYFFFDHVRGWMGRMVLGPGNTVASVDSIWLATPFSGSGSGPVDMQQGPDGALYYNTFVPGQIRRISYVGSANRRPNVVASAAPTNGYVALVVDFSSQGTFDADGDSLAYDWSFGDGSPGSSEPNPSHSYAANGVFSARLTVTDGHGGSSVAAAIPITVGNLGPVVTIAAPLDGSFFDDGQEIAFSGTAFDPELGPMPPESLHWRVFLNHLDHIHPVILDQVGGGGTFTASFHNEEPQNIHYTVTAWATDAFGLRTERSVRIDANPSSPGGTLRLFQVDATDRDATSVAGELKTTGLDAGMPFDYISNDGDPFAAALQFRLDVPQGAEILAANLIVRGGSGQVASPTGALAVRVYDTGDCAPFAAGPGDLESLYPTMSGSVEWASPGEWIDEDVMSPDLTALVQAYVARPDYAAGGHIGFLLTRGTIELGSTYAFTDFSAAGQPSRLRLEYRVATPSVEPRRPVFALRPNWPNPFNPTTRIEFELENVSPVKLEVLDVQGRIVRRLERATLGAGPHFSVWDGRDQRGRACASGVYLYRLTTPARAEARRMVLVR